jgi:flagellar hook-associated protein FlgK
LRDELDTLAQVFVGEVNKVHALGINAHGTFGGELFSLGNVYSVTPGLNTGSGFVTVSAVPDAKIEKLTMAISYSDSTKNWTLTDTASETTVSGTSELTMGGIKVTLTGVPKDGDTFSLKSNKRPIDALQVSVTNHLNIAAGGAVSVARASTNTSISRVILNSYSKPAAPVANTSMDTALRNNISQVAASTITPSTNLAFVIPANTQNSQFYSTDSGSAAALEVDTITLSAAVASSGSVSYTYAGTTYTKAFDTDAATTMSGLVAAINAGAAGSTVTAAAVSGTVFTITKDAGSGTQMTKGTIGGTSNGSTELTITTADTTAGVDNTVQMQVFTREGKQIYGSALNSSEQSSLLTTANGFSTNAAYDSTYNNQTGSNAYMDANVTVTNPTSGDTRDYFAMAGSLKEDLLVFVTGSGSAEVSGQWGSLATVDLRDQLRQNIDVQFAADASTYVLKDVTTNTNIASGTFTAGSTIEHNGWKVSFDGVIKANDKFSIRGNTYQAGDNRNLLNIIDLQGNKDIFSGRGDFTEVYTDVIGNLGNSVVQSAVSRDAQQIIFDQAQAKRDETSAVSLDEEAADLLRFQQAYQASAQIISTANKLFDTILGIG